MSLVAGIDSSTQSCTVEVRDGDSGELLGRASTPHPATHPPRSEQDPEQWWQALGGALRLAADDAGVAVRDLDALSVGAQCHGLVMQDGAGRVLRPAKLWNDTESAPQAAELTAAWPQDHWARRIGLVPSAALTIAKLRWVAQHEPEHLSALASVCVPHDYLTWRLTGERVTDRSDASGTGYFGLDDAWQPDLLADYVDDSVRWEDMLPRVLTPSEAAGVVSSRAAEELGLRAGAIVGPGGGDQHVGALGLGLRVGDVAISLGTSGVVMSPSRSVVLDDDGWIDCVADAAGGYLPLACTLNSTKVTDMWARVLGVSVEQLGEWALEADPERTPTLLAYLDGERSPRRPDASGLMSGLRSDTTSQELARAAFDGVVSGLVRAWLSMEHAGLSITGDVVVAGGGARSLAYRQLLADALGHPVQVRDAADATARGATVQAAAVLRGVDVAEVADQWRPGVRESTAPRTVVGSGVSAEYLTLARLEDERVAELRLRERRD